MVRLKITSLLKYSYEYNKTKFPKKKKKNCYKVNTFPNNKRFMFKIKSPCV